MDININQRQNIIMLYKIQKCEKDEPQFLFSQLNQTTIYLALFTFFQTHTQQASYKILLIIFIQRILYLRIQSEFNIHPMDKLLLLTRYIFRKIAFNHNSIFINTTRQPFKEKINQLVQLLKRFKLVSIRTYSESLKISEHIHYKKIMK